MKFGLPLIAVSDMERSKRFYRDVFGLEVTGDFGANVILSDCLSLQTADSWRGFIGGREVIFGGNAFELYFEEDDLGTFMEKLSAMDIRYVHPLIEHSWGQRAVRLFDPDGHVIEIGEAMDGVIRRFIAGGMTAGETAARMDVPLAYVLERIGN